MASPQLVEQDTSTKCPYCGKVNPEIRRIVSFVSTRGVTVIYSCAHCKRIINLETILNGTDPLAKEPDDKKAA
jgi:DNA-directed RNA polymerase subunit RPC12/RpoP